MLTDNWGSILSLLLVWKHSSLVFLRTFISKFEFVRHLRSFRLSNLKRQSFVANLWDRKPDIGGVLLFFGVGVCSVSPVKSIESIK